MAHNADLKGTAQDAIDFALDKLTQGKHATTFLSDWRKDEIDTWPTYRTWLEVRRAGTPPCGYTEPESTWRDPDTGKHRTARCEGRGRLVVRGTGLDAVTDGKMFITARDCPRCLANKAL